MATNSSLEPSRSMRVMRTKVVECNRPIRQTRVAFGAASWQTVTMPSLRPSLLIVAVLAAVSGCGTSPAGENPLTADGGMPVDDANPADGLNEVQFPPIQFPPGFIFGTAIAGFQADMGCPKLSSPQCDDKNSDWYDFTTARATVS